MCKKNTMEINREEGEEGKIETSYARFELRPRYIPYIDADLINKFTVVFFFFFFKCKKKKHDEIHLRKITWMDKKRKEVATITIEFHRGVEFLQRSDATSFPRLGS